MAASWLLAGGTASSAAATGMTEWAASGHSAARLIGAGTSSGTKAELLAGVALRLDPGYLTYWRAPGEAGLPPTFDWSGSVNVASVTVDYPAPRRLDEGGSTAFGYVDAVIFPLHIVRSDPSRPATLALTLDYGVCAALCLPAKARLSLALEDRVAPEAVAMVAAALAQVPRKAPLGAAGPLAIVGVAAPEGGNPATLAVSAHATPAANLFVEAPEGWYLQPGAAVATGEGQVTFAMTVLDRPDGPGSGAVDLRLTLVEGSDAVETSVRVTVPGHP